MHDEPVLSDEEKRFLDGWVECANCGKKYRAADRLPSVAGVCDAKCGQLGRGISLEQKLPSAKKSS